GAGRAGLGAGIVWGGPGGAAPGASRAASFRTAAASSPRVCYVMQDGGALPAWFSRTVAGLRAAGWLAATVTTGQSFGGDLEAVTVHTGLLAARHVAGADVAVVTQGPGHPPPPTPCRVPP